MPKQTQTTQPRPHGTNVGVRFKHRHHSLHENYGGEWLLPQPQAEGRGVAEHVQGEDAEEEGAEGVEDFGEEVPPLARVGGEIGEVEGWSVEGQEEGGGVGGEEEEGEG